MKSYLEIEYACKFFGVSEIEIILIVLIVVEEL